MQDQAKRHALRSQRLGQASVKHVVTSTENYGNLSKAYYLSTELNKRGAVANAKLTMQRDVAVDAVVAMRKKEPQTVDQILLDRNLSIDDLENFSSDDLLIDVNSLFTQDFLLSKSSQGEQRYLELFEGSGVVHSTCAMDDDDDDDDDDENGDA
jgi:hypothetical protein